MWDVQTGNCVKTFSVRSDSVTAVQLDGRLIVSSSVDGMWYAYEAFSAHHNASLSMLFILSLHTTVLCTSIYATGAVLILA